MSAPGAAAVAVPLRGGQPAVPRLPLLPPANENGPWRAAIVYGLAVLGLTVSATGLTFKITRGIAPDIDPVLDTVTDALVGSLFLSVGAFAHARRPENRVGLLMVLVGLAYAAEDMQLSTSPWVRLTGLLLTSASTGPIVHLVLAFPPGELGSRLQRVLVTAGYGASLVLTPMLRVLFDGRFGINSDPTIFGLAFLVREWIDLALAATVLVVLLRRWRSASTPLRRTLTPVLVTGLVGGAPMLIMNLMPTDWPVVRAALAIVTRIAIVLFPLVFLLGVVRVRLGRSVVADLLDSLRGPLTPAELRDQLARTLRDASLQVGYWRADSRGLVDADGVPLALLDDATRALTVVERDGQRIAALIHDPAVGEDEHVLQAVTAAAGLALDNQRLTAEVRAQLAEVRASRARIVAAADEQRRRVERDLHDGAQQQLLTVALTLRLTQQRLDRHPDPELAALLDRAATGLADALAELRELGRGIHPAILTDAGLLPALRALVQRAPGPVELAEGPVPRLPAPVEATAYFVAAEALTNAFKHAHATRVRVSVSYDGTALHVTVDDDGVGGANTEGGSGLLGLFDRVRAVDGDLTVRSAPGEGTSVHATLPAR